MTASSRVHRRCAPRPWLALAAGLAVGLAACQGPDSSAETGVGATDGPPEGIDDAPVVISEVAPPPISGGTLLLIEDGRAAVASDPDRDLVHGVDLWERTRRFTITLREGARPGRLVADAHGRVHVVLRGAGAVLGVDPERGEIVDRRAVCPNPRGIAYDPEADALHVACAGGSLVTLPAEGGPPTRRLQLSVDLRDVVDTDHGLVVTTFRSAEVIVLDEAGVVRERFAPPVLEDHGSRGVERIRPGVAWRTLAMPGGRWLMLHQGAVTDAPAEPDDARTGETEGSGYGAAPGSSCTGVVHPVVTMGDGGLDTKTTGRLPRTPLAVDVALSPDGEHLALAVPGADDPRRRLVTVPTDAMTSSVEAPCPMPIDVPQVEGLEGQYVAVAYDPTGYVVAQSREPAEIVRFDPHRGPHPGPVETIALHGPSREHTGHALFHRDAGGSITCASCHPEGGDDGAVWEFPAGPRHTPALAIGLEGTEPFHWEGDLADMRALVAEVHERRMDGRPLSEARIDALATWLFGLTPPTPLRRADEAAVQRGAARFVGWGCDGCHRGPTLAGGPDNVWMGSATLQVPGLRGVALHPPYMHDGRAPDLRAAVLDMLGRTQPQADPTAEDVASLVAYLESL